MKIQNAIGFVSLELPNDGGSIIMNTEHVTIHHSPDENYWILWAHFGDVGVQGPMIEFTFLKTHVAKEYKIEQDRSPGAVTATMGEGTLGGGAFSGYGEGNMIISEVAVAGSSYRIKGTCEFEHNDRSVKRKVVVKEFRAQTIAE
ncbi:hypothetical protein [Pseudomonas triticicola]|uniref:hypothetical protein n=1 Tax=Pseudomonas triticicola TaxID=2842345 RepID=UPI003EB8CDC6